ncbi:MAG: hypothetical protein IJL26_05740 [Clostridia bacterium]|nr:hypothetical protein [Clostridia bacterium]
MNSRKTFKKILALLMTVMMIVSVAPMGLIAAYAVENEPVTEEASVPTGKNRDPETVAFTITVKDGEDPVAGAKVTIGETEVTTGGDGAAAFELPADTYEYTVECDGYVKKLGSAAVSAESTAFTASLTKRVQRSFKFNVTDAFDDSAVAAEDIAVTANGETLEADGDGKYTVTAYNDADVIALKIVPSDADKYAELTRDLDPKADEFSADTTLSLPRKTYEVTVTTADGSRTTNVSYGGTATVTEAQYTSPDYAVDKYFVNEGEGQTPSGDVSVAITGPTTIVFSYYNNITFAFDPAMGSVAVDGTDISDGAVRKVGKGSTSRYTVTAKAGYEISAITENGAPVAEAENRKSFEKEIGDSANAIAVTFREIKYNVTVKVFNTEKKLGSLTVDDGVLALAQGDGSASHVYTVDHTNLQTNGTYTLNLTVGDPPAGYTYTFDGGTQEYDAGRSFPVTGVTADRIVNIRLKAVKHTVTYVDPFAEEPVTTEERTVEDTAFALPALTAPEGYSGLGWVPSSEAGDTSAPIDLTGCTAQAAFSDAAGVTGDLTYFAFYQISKRINVTAASTLPYLAGTADPSFTADYAPGSDKITTAYFAADVKLTADGMDGADVVYTVNGGEEKTAADGEIDLTVDDAAESAYVFTLGRKAEKTAGGFTFVYASAATETFTVNTDIKAPTLDVKDSTPTDQAESVDKITFADDGSGVAAVQKLVINGTENPEYEVLASYANNTTADNFGTLVSELKAKLRQEESWTTIAGPDPVSPVQNSYVYNPDEYVVYRVIDNAGNDVYSSFDRTVPEITNVAVTYAAKTGDTSLATATGSFIAADKIVVTATVKDKRLAFTDGAFIYDGAKLLVYDAETGDKIQEISMTDAAEKFSFFYDKWECEFTLTADNFPTDRAVNIRLTAQDQAENKADAWSFNTSGTLNNIVLSAEQPTVALTYDYMTVTGDTSTDAVVSNDSITVHIAVSGAFFDISQSAYYSATETDASVSVRGSDGTDYTDAVVWSSKTQDGWTGTLTLDEADDLTLTVTAKNEVGTEGAADSAVLSIDGTPPEISVAYTYTAKDADQSIAADGTAATKSYTVTDPTDTIINNGNKGGIVAEITITDDHLYPFMDARDNASYVVKVNGTALAAADVTEKEKTATKLVLEVTLPDNVGDAEGQNGISVNCTDHVGAEASYSFDKLCNDNSELTVESVTVTLAEPSNFYQQVLHAAGAYYKKDLTAVVVVSDDSALDIASGVNSVVLLYRNGGADGAAETDAVLAADSVSEADGKYTYTFILPETDGDAKEYWEKNLHIAAVDNAGNCLDLDLTGGSPIVTMVDTTILYETEKPVIAFDGTVDALYVGNDVNGEETYWLKKDANLPDLISATDDSGLYEVKAFVNGAQKFAYSVNDVKEDVQTAVAVELANADLASGVNTVRVLATDIAGNKAVEQAYTIYKDTVGPVAGDLALSGADGGNKLSHGNYYNSDVTVTVDATDAAASSGLASAQAWYVASTGEETALTLSTDLSALKKANADADVAGSVSFVLTAADVMNTSGYIKVKLTDNAGFETETEFDDTVLTIENVESEIALVTEAPFSTADDPAVPCFGADVDTLQIAVSETSGDVNSGIRTVEIKLNGTTVVDEDERAAFTAEKTYDVDVSGKVDGVNTLTVTVVDNAGNTAVENIAFNADLTAPVITKIALSLKNTDSLSDVLRRLTFGNFFNATAVLTVTVRDPDDAAYASGPSSLLVYADADEPYTAVLENPDRETEKAFTVELPFDTAGDVTSWIKSISLVAADNAGNESEKKALKDYPSDGLVNSELIVFETLAPVVTASGDLDGDGTGRKDADVLYTGNGMDWLKKDAAYTVNVSDDAEDAADNSGLKAVSVKLNGTDKYAYTNDLSGDGTDRIFTLAEPVEIAYDDFTEGENTILVNAEDIAGNLTEKEIKVYKDVTNPVLTAVTIEDNSGSKLSYGNFFSTDITAAFSLLDASSSSGIASVAVKYISDQGETDLVETDGTVPESDALDGGAENSITRSFDLAKVDNAEGYLFVTVTDNVGNVSEFGEQDGEVPGDDIAINRIVFETAPAKITETHTAPDFVRPDYDDCYNVADLADSGISYTISVDDTGDGVKASGIRSIETTLNGVTVAAATSNEAAAYTDKKDYTFELSAVTDDAGELALREGENVIVVKVVDNAGNENEASGKAAEQRYTVYIDHTQPVITALRLEQKESTPDIRAFGNFFNGTVTLSVVASDGIVDAITKEASNCDAGVRSATMRYVEFGSETQKEVTVESSGSEAVDGVTYYTFEIELPVKDVPEAELDAWKAQLEISVCDNLGNATEFVAINALAEGLANVASGEVLYETTAPGVVTSIDEEDSDALYFETDKASYWLKKDQSFAIAVDDADAEGSTDYSSGLNTVTVTINGAVSEVGAYSADMSADDQITYRYETAVAYDDLTEGRNTIVVTAQDNAGNVLPETEYVVYKDTDLPEVTALNLKAKSGTRLAHGNYFNTDVVATIGVADAEFSSGISTIEAVYVAGDERFDFVERDNGTVPESSPLTAKDTKLSRTFDLAEVENTKGYLEITITDNVGNVFVFDQDSDLPAKKNIEINAILFENTPATITETHTAPDYVRNGVEDCYRLPDLEKADVSYTVTVDDTGDGIEASGIRTIETTLNGVTVADATADEREAYTDKKEYTFRLADVKDADGNLALREGENEIVVKVVDNAGNKSEASGNSEEQRYTIFVDNTLPRITSLTMEIVDANKVLNVLTLGNYFNGKVLLTVGATDADGVCDTGVRSATITYKDLTDGGEIKTKEVTESTYDVGSKTYFFVFELPIDAQLDGDDAVNEWKASMSVRIADNVGNETANKAIAKLGDEIESLSSSTVLYETRNPNVNSTLEIETGAVDAEVFYRDEANDAYWIFDGKDFVISVDDNNSKKNAYDSGLSTVTVARNAQIIGDYGFAYVDGEKRTFSHEIPFAYDKLVNGKNEIVVRAVDLAGNETVKRYTVYKDGTAPAVSRIDINDTYGSRLPYGNFYDSNISLPITFSDAEYSSGIRDVKATYVTSDGKKHALVERDAQSPESDPLTSGKTELTRVFDLEAVFESDGYLVITVTDNVGNTSTFGKNSKVPKGSNISVNRLMFDSKYIKITETDTKEDYLLVGKTTDENGKEIETKKRCYMSFDIDLTLSFDDTAEETSGIRSIRTTLNGKTVPNATVELSESLTATRNDVSFNLGKDCAAACKEGENVVHVEATDNAGSVTKRDYVFYVDLTDPVVTAIRMDTVETGGVLNLLKFGNFFNKEVELTVVATDSIVDAVSKKPSICDTGVKFMTLSYVDCSGDEPVEKTVEKTDFEEQDGSYTFKFRLPIVGEEAEENPLEYWRSNLSLLLGDNVGNVTESLAIDRFGDEIENFDSSFVLYEKQAPNVSSSADSKDGAPDTDVLYVDEATDTLWIRKGQSFRIDVNDVNVADYDSGLYSVTVSNNGKVYEQQTYGYALAADRAAQTQIFEKTFRISYDDLHEGLNRISVVADDNAGNRTGPYVQFVYKDIDDPVISRVELRDYSTLLDYGTFYNKDLNVDVTVDDAADTAGIRSVVVKYVTDGGRSYELVEDETQKQSPEHAADADGKAVNVVRSFTLAAKPDTTGWLEVYVTDNVGNTAFYGKDSDTAVSNARSTFIMFEMNGLDIAMTESAPDYTCKDEHALKWYKSSDIDVEIMVNESENDVVKSAIKHIVTTLNGTRVDEASASDVSAAGYVYELPLRFNVGEILRDGAEVCRDGENMILVTATDNAGNVTSLEHKVYLDRVHDGQPNDGAPVVEGFAVSDEEMPSMVKTDYGYYFGKTTTVTVKVSDLIPGSGIKAIYFCRVPVTTAESVDEDRSIRNISPDTNAATTCVLDAENAENARVENGRIRSDAEFTIEAGFKGQIYAYVEDNVGNISAKDASDYTTWENPEKMILEKEDHHIAEGDHVFITTTDTNFVRMITNSQGQSVRLYKDDATINLAVSDLYAGIRSVTYKVWSEYDNRTEKNNVPTSFKVIDDVGIEQKDTNTVRFQAGQTHGGWHIDSVENNIVTRISQTIDVPNNSNDIKITLEMTDNAGNTSSKDLTISIDKDAPIITVAVVPGPGADDAEHTGYFNQDRVMTVTIRERNFDPSLVNITATQNGAPYGIGSGFGAGVMVTENGIQYYEYVLTHTFHDDGDYTFAIQATDMAENLTTEDDDDQVNYGSEAEKAVAKTFTIDETAPVITVDISGQLGKDIYYYGDVTVTIQVTEHNYDPNRYTVVFDTKDSLSGAPVGAAVPQASYSENGDVRTYVYVFHEEFMYRLASISVTDMAGNVTTDVFTGSYAQGSDFVVDQTEPVIRILKQDASTALDHVASKEEDFGPVIILEDTNLDPSASSYSISIYGYQHLGYVNYSYASAAAPGRMEIRYSSFPMDETYDDVYEINVAVTDLSGRSTTAQALFSVNRFGSTFMVAPSTGELIKRYYTNTETDVELIQINAAEVTEQEVSVSRNNSPTTLQKDADYSIEEWTAKKDENGRSTWYEYDYRILKKNFVSEGMYAVTIFSKDQAEEDSSSAVSKRTIDPFSGVVRSDRATLANKRLSDDILSEEDLSAPVRFIIDKTAPIASIIDYEDNDEKQIRKMSQDIFFAATDDVALDKIELRVGERGGVIDVSASEPTAIYEEKDIKDNKAVYNLNETNTHGEYKKLSVVAYDKAGNVSEQYSTTLQVTTNLIKLFFGSVPAMIITGTVLAGGVIVLIVLLKRKKNKEEPDPTPAG